MKVKDFIEQNRDKIRDEDSLKKLYDLEERAIKTIELLERDHNVKNYLNLKDRMRQVDRKISLEKRKMSLETLEAHPAYIECDHLIGGDSCLYCHLKEVDIKDFNHKMGIVGPLNRFPKDIWGRIASDSIAIDLVFSLRKQYPVMKSRDIVDMVLLRVDNGKNANVVKKKKR